MGLSQQIRSRRCEVALVIIAMMLGGTGHADIAAPSDALTRGFEHPPQEARPRVWWHWMNGNVTEEGIRLDLEWMKRVGIAGVQNFDAALHMEGAADTPRQVEKPLDYLTPDWRHAFRYSVELANRLGLEFTIASSPGWSLTGGPWVKPKEAMKKLVWSETTVSGGQPFNGRLIQPPDVSGMFQDIPFAKPGDSAGESDSPPRYYADVATIAYRAPATEQAPANLKAAITSSAGAIEFARLSDRNLAQSVPLAFGKDGLAWVRFAFDRPQRVQAVTAVFSRSVGWRPEFELDPVAWLESSDDGRTFRKISELTRSGTLQTSALAQTVSFSAVTARMFRVVIERPAASSASAHVAELVLHPGARVNRFEDKAGYSSRQIVESDDTPAIPQGEAIQQREVVDLTSRMRADGSVDWTPPAGRWVILRFGYSLTGRTNHPASRVGTGLEVDKLTREYVRRYMDAYLGEYARTLGPQLMGHKGLQSVLADSYEAGVQNWTDDMLQQFSQRRGYDARAWLPVLAGRVVDSAAASDRFLWDVRQTIADLTMDAHYAQLFESARTRGMTTYGESHEFSRAFIGDGMQAKKAADVPMGATWAAPIPGFTQQTLDADIRESASVAHVYGKRFVAAESLTAFGLSNEHPAYGFAPQDLKRTADRMMAMGLNRFVIHTSVHQPDSRTGPGIGLGLYGQWFTRKETWAEQAGPWIEYLSRSSYLLQQGRFVADIAWFYGEDTNVTALFFERGPSVPAGYSFDFMNPDALVNELSVKDGKLITRSGMEYRVLVIDPSVHRMSVRVLRKLRDLVREGAVIVGARPTQTPSLADDETEFRALVDAIWDGAGGHGSRAVGVFADQSAAEVLRSQQVPPDVELLNPADAELRFVHRALENDVDVYFVSSASDRPLTIEAGLRVSGTRPELWRADTGVIAPLSYRIENRRTVVSLRLEPNDAVFVVFRQRTDVYTRVVPEPTSELLTALNGPWAVSFPPGLGAPAQARFEALHSWTENAEEGIKYFSGTAVYSRTMRIRKEWLKKNVRLQIELGDVKNLAEVIVNGRSLGVLWKAPFVLDITDAVKAGDNDLEIRVTNLWPNRLIGDKQPGAHRVAYATFDPYTADSPLLAAGLLGPVRLCAVKGAR